MPRDLFAEQKQPRDLFADEAPKELPAANRFLSGVGGEVLKAGSGIADLLPENAAHQWLKEKSKQGLDKATGAAGEVGKFVGASAPYVALPGGGILKTAALSAALSGATTEGDISDRATQAALTGVTSYGMGKAFKNAGNYLLAKKVASAEKAKILNADNAGRAAAQKAGMDVGFVNSPSEANPTILNNLLESVAGKASVRQAAQIQNANKSTLMTRRALGLSDDTQLDDAAFKSVLEKNYQPYRDIAELPTPPSLAQGYSGSKPVFNAKDDLELLKIAQANARELYRANSVNPHPETKALLDEELLKASNIEARFNDRATKAGRPEIVNELMKARENIAKTYTAKDATNKVTGSVDARDFGKRIDKGKPLTGEMRIAGEFEQAFPNSIRDPEHVPAPNVNQLIHAIMPIVGGTAGGVVSGGNPLGVAAGVVASEAVPRMAKALLLSGPYQRTFAKIPIAEKSKVLSIVEQIINNDLRKTATPAISNALSQRMLNNE